MAVAFEAMAIFCPFLHVTTYGRLEPHYDSVGQCTDRMSRLAVCQVGFSLDTDLLVPRSLVSHTDYDLAGATAYHTASSLLGSWVPHPTNIDISTYWIENTQVVPIGVDNITNPVSWLQLESLFTHGYTNYYPLNTDVTVPGLSTALLDVDFVVLLNKSVDGLAHTIYDSLVPYNTCGIVVSSLYSSLVTQLLTASIWGRFIFNEGVCTLSPALSALLDVMNIITPYTNASIPLALQSQLLDYCYRQLPASTLHGYYTRFLDKLRLRVQGSPVSDALFNQTPITDTITGASYTVPLTYSSSSFGSLNVTGSGSQSSLVGSYQIRDGSSVSLVQGSFPNSLTELRTLLRRELGLSSVLPAFPFDAGVIDAVCASVHEMFKEASEQLHTDCTRSDITNAERDAEVKAAFILAILRA